MSALSRPRPPSSWGRTVTAASTATSSAPRRRSCGGRFIVGSPLRRRARRAVWPPPPPSGTGRRGRARRGTGVPAGSSSSTTSTMRSASSSVLSASRPELPSSTASTCPGIRVATVGVPQAAASVRVSPNPSRTGRAGHHPGPAVPVDELVVGDPAGPLDPAGAGVAGDGLEAVAVGSVAHDRGLERRHGGLGPHEGGDQLLDALLGHEAAHGHDEGGGRAGPAGGEAVGDAVRGDRDAGRVGAVVVDDLVTGGIGCGHEAPALVDGRHREALDEVTDPSGPAGEQVVPGAEVHVVDQSDLGRGRPQRREERDAVEDLDDAVGRARGGRGARRAPW